MEGLQGSIGRSQSGSWNGQQEMAGLEALEMLAGGLKSRVAAVMTLFRGGIAKLSAVLLRRWAGRRWLQSGYTDRE